MEAIRVFREQANLTQQQVADLAGISQSVLSRWETGQVEPGRSSLERLAAVLGIEPDDLLYAERVIARRRAVRETVEEYVAATA